MNSSNKILVNIDKGVMLISFNRPEKKNAITAEMYQMLNNALAKASSDDEIRVVLFAGEGDCFTAGNDLKDFLDFNGEFEETEVVRFIRTLGSFDKPIVAAVHGNSVGIGTTMLLHCDLVVAATNSVFAMPFVKLGLCPEAASSLLLPKLAGYQQAAELLILGEAFDTEKADKIGLINRVVETEHVRSEAMKLCQKLVSLPVEALSQTRQLLKSPASSMTQHMSDELVINIPGVLEQVIAITGN